MKITACLAWYDEQPELLEQCVRSLAEIADELVAFDGAWRLQPNALGWSPSEQHEAIHAAAADSGIETSIVTMAGPWPSQVEKRTQLLASATATGADWLFVIDADEHIRECDPDALAGLLTATDRDVASVACQRYANGFRSGPPRLIRRFYRAAAGVTVERAHNGYRTADGRWLHGDPCAVRLEPTLDLGGVISLVHDTTARPDYRRHAAREYRQRRTREQVEAWA